MSVKDCHNIFIQYSEKWAKIPYLKSLKILKLEEYWNDVDIVTNIILDKLSDKLFLIHHSDTIHDIINQLFRLGDFTRAEIIIKKVLETPDNENSRRIKIKYLAFLGKIYFQLREFDNAIQTFISGFNKLHDTDIDSILRLLILSNLSIAYTYIDDYDKGLKYGFEGIYKIDKISENKFNSLSKQIKGPSYSCLKSAFLSNIGVIYAIKGKNHPENSDLRIEFLKKASHYYILSLINSVSLEEKIRSYVNYGEIIMLQGELNRSNKLFKNLLQKCETNLNLNRLRSYIIGFQAKIANLKNEPEKAIHYCHKSLCLANAVSDPILAEDIILSTIKPFKIICTNIFNGVYNSNSFEKGGMRVIKDLLEFLEQKDWYTAHSHAKGVRRITLKLYDAMKKFPERFILKYDRKTVGISALLHDIGKLWIPWTILNRTTPLLFREHQMLKNHPTLGQSFIDSIGFPLIGEIISRHHERPDGKGYPSGGNIGEMCGRIIAVADSYEAMTTTNRLYRKPLSKKEAIRKIIDLSGTQFDKNIVDILPNVVLN